MHLLHANACSATAQTRGATRTTATRPRNPGLEQIARAVAASQNTMTALRLVRRCETPCRDWEAVFGAFPPTETLRGPPRELRGTALSRQQQNPLSPQVAP